MQLTKRQSEVLAFIKQFNNDKGYTPTAAEISEHFGFASPNAAYDHMKRIKDKGYITMTPSIARGIGILESNPLAKYSLEELEAEFERRRAFFVR